MNSFETVTELPGIGAHRGQISVLRTRYDFAARFTAGKDVVEVACGGGIGVGYLGRNAKSVLGGDIDPTVLRFAQEHYAGRENVSVRKLDAMNLDIPDASFDVVVCFEALYYFESLRRFLEEASRVLRPGGILVGSSVNCEWHGFNPSPFSRHYYTVAELKDELSKAGFSASMFVGFEDDPQMLKRRILSLIRAIAVSLRIIPKTMKGKELLKRLFYGRLTPLPNELTPEFGEMVEPVALTSEIKTRNYAFIYFVGKKQ